MVTLQGLIDWYLNHKYDTITKIMTGFTTVYNCAYGHFERKLPNGTVKLICDDDILLDNLQYKSFAESVRCIRE